MKNSRSRFRQFRSRLSQEVQESNVLPKDLQRRVVSELDKRLDIDLDSGLTSPTLRLKLAPAELDKQLLELYNKVSQSPSGDVLRVVGGGIDVGKQNLYVKQESRKHQKQTEESSFWGVDGSTSSQHRDGNSNDESSPTTLIKETLRRHMADTGGQDDDTLPSHPSISDDSNPRSNSRLYVTSVPQMRGFGSPYQPRPQYK